MYELHENEQYFFSDETVKQLADFVIENNFALPCCLCCPLLGRELAERGIETRILDVDERFANVNGFQPYDLYRPRWTGEKYGIIVCDPPFFKVSLAQLFTAVRVLAQHDFAQPLMLFYLSRRAANVTGTFARFNLRATGWQPRYQTVQQVERNQIEAFSNLPMSP
ncbi:MAG TPA: hypothetical protein VM821_06845 [Abditibacteriaceae bacterium]|jgi:hypothetical protein|nr:hypothetical protein [Abditibacteriaceae bacterium]